MADSELIECTLDDGTLNLSNWGRATLTNCSFRGAWFGLATFERAVISGGDMLGAYLERSSWTAATISNTSFRSATLVDAFFDDATFVDCEFQFADLSHKVEMDDAARAPNTRFVRCRFNGANLEGLTLNNTVFEDCWFYDSRGTPTFAGPTTFVNADFSKRHLASINDPDRLVLR